MKFTFQTYPRMLIENLLSAFEDEFTYAFGGCTVVRGLEGSYLPQAGASIPDRINLICTDLPLALSTHFDRVARYVGELKQVSLDALAEESIFIAGIQVYHAV